MEPGPSRDRISDLYHRALACTPEDRGAFLEEACGGDTGLREEVESLLRFESDSARFLETPAAVVASDLAGARDRSQMIGRHLGPYSIIAPLGAGGMGEVYRARDSKLGRDVAIKILPSHFTADAERRSRFAREARLLATLNHPHIGAIYGLEETDGLTALVLELVEGPTLADRLERGPLKVSDALAIARQIAEALEAAHEKGIVHRDLKPANIILQGAGGLTSSDARVKVLDFGLAKLVHADPETDATPSGTLQSTEDGRILGTPGYMSPEQARGLPIDKRTDIWAFGCVLYEMLTGKRAFQGDDASEIAATVLTKEPDWNALPAGLQPALRVFLRRCLRKDPKQRVRDMGDIRLAIDGAFEVASGIDDEPRRRHPTRHLLTATASALALAAATAAAVWLFASGRTDARTISFVVHPPERTAFAVQTMDPYPTLSQDGRYLAFRAPLESRFVIWIQALGELEARPLSGTEAGGSFFWSPDSRSIGFSVDGRLMKIAAVGGSAPQELCVCRATWGGTWNSDGTIVFGTTDGGLYHVSSNGAQALPVTRLDESRGEFSHRWPLFLPGGRRFVYLVRSTRDEHRGVYLGSLDEPALKRRLVPDDSNAAYGIGPDGQGYLFFVRDLVLLAQPFEVERGELMGSPAVMARPVIPGQGGRLAPFSVQGRTLVYRQLAPAENRLVWVSRGGFPEATLGAAGADYRNPALSADGTFVAASLRDPRSGKNDIWLLDTRRPVRERLTTDPVDALFPVWLTDGSRVVFASAREGPWNLYSRSTSGRGGEESLYSAPTPGLKFPLDVTRDGRFLLFLGDQQALWALPLVDERHPVLLLSQALAARVSPDGRWMAYATGQRDLPVTGSGGSELPFEADAQVYVTTFPKPTERWRISTAGGSDPQWSSDGKELYYIADQTLMSVAVRAGTTFNHETPKPLFRVSFNRVPGSAYATAPDGQRFLVNEKLREDQRLLTVTMNWRLDAQQ